MRDPIIPELLFEEFLSWEARQPEKFELHSGFIVAFAGGTSIHNTLSLNLVFALRRCYPPPCRAYGSDMKVRVSENTSYYPDASATCEEVAEGASFIESPQIVGEVLSPSTRTYDLIDKRAAYRRLPGLLASVIVHTDRRLVEVDRTVFGRWETVNIDDGRIAVGRLSVDLDEIYAMTSLASTT
jgi:Uma2 family endonuclease